jgi:glucosyl-3-phosphoglycerate synthase
MYADNAGFSGLVYDTNHEEAMVHGVFKNAIVNAGDLLISPYQVVDRFSTFVGSHKAFEPYLAESHRANRSKGSNQAFETPQTVPWERAARRLSKIFFDIIDVVAQKKKRYLI